MIKFLKVLLYITWELIQNIIGGFLIITGYIFGNFYNKEKIDGVTYYIFKSFFRSGVSMGRFIILDKVYCQERHYKDGLVRITVLHEDGHRKQSLMLGPLYLFVVGIPSALHNLHNRTLINKVSDVERQRIYYNWYCEKWADKLGGIIVDRELYLKNKERK